MCIFFVSLWSCCLCMRACVSILFLWCSHSFHWGRIKSNRMDRMNLAIKVWNFSNIFSIRATRSAQREREREVFFSLVQLIFSGFKQIHFVRAGIYFFFFSPLSLSIRYLILLSNWWKYFNINSSWSSYENRIVWKACEYWLARTHTNTYRHVRLHVHSPNLIVCRNVVRYIYFLVYIFKAVN